MKLGLLLPRSTFQPLLQHDLLAGCKAYMAHRELPVELVTANIGYGTDVPAVFAAAEKMLMEDNVDVLAIYADQDSLQQIADFARAVNKLVILLHPGARYFHAWEPHTHVISHTLHHSLCCRFTAELAATKAAAAAYATSFFDCGFPASHSLSQHYADNGGQIEHNFISKFNSSDFSISPLVDFLRQQPAVTSVLSMYNGDLAYYFLRQLQEAAIPNLEVFAAPMVFEPSLATAHGALPPLSYSLQGYLPWAAAIELPANKIFTDTCAAATNRVVNSAMMHGWTTAQLVEYILQGASQHQYAATAIMKHLATLDIATPRGTLHFDAATHHTLAPVWQATAGGDMVVKINGNIPDITPAWSTMKAAVEGVVTTHWFNTYPCA
ncbi:ABC-type branched-chain amino acid transport system, substrate-binding protein [Chitinophaga jiangningensis]|uniref:ABC-type branched-chain amino acid transport system, substrate-binding protein n=1 Tax=Chitinophaga jiangningensis TaxID=1419482 RepID=A0A1M7J2T0_9BACT|nr:ABC transporter substrate-binding protein [Chitinophaga jiangningensis]SHM47268.1 ABC-type branched-chain amino acid transport system, substrate-binding protein [Chitinophaga jiangningensis]